MGIRFYCPNGHRLHVKGFQAGKRGICPHCDARFRIPQESEIPKGSPRVRTELPLSAVECVKGDPVATAEPAQQSFPVGMPDAASPGSGLLLESPDQVWYVRPPSGGQYGPARGDVMERWLAEGRVSSDTLVWREGWPEWRLAGPLFPNLPAETAEAEIATEPDSTKHELSDVVVKPEEAAMSSPRPYARRSPGLSGAKPVGLIVGLVILALGLVVALVIVLNYRA